MATVVTDVYLVRHGETQGYSSESGLTPLGSWQAHPPGPGDRPPGADWPPRHHGLRAHQRARQTAEHLRRGLADNLRLFGRDAEVSAITAMPEFGNFAVATPDGPRDVTSAFRHYHREMEKYERIGLGERPGWLVEVDPVLARPAGRRGPHHPLAVAADDVLRAADLLRAAVLGRYPAGPAGDPWPVGRGRDPLGPVRAFATWAMGYDPGEPFNAEFVRVRLIEGGVTALITYRNRVQEMRVPSPADLPAAEDTRFGLPAREDTLA